MKTYICTRCNHTIYVGHPASHFKYKALLLARDTYSMIARIFSRRVMRRKVQAALEERYYLEPNHFRTRPSSCPGCGCRGSGDNPWWRPGFSFKG